MCYGITAYAKFLIKNKIIQNNAKVVFSKIPGN